MKTGVRATLLVLAAALTAIGPHTRAQEKLPEREQDRPKEQILPLIPAENHPWARFPVGSWTLSRVTKEAFDARGVATTSVEEIKKTLKLAGPTSYTLTIERSLQIGEGMLRLQGQEQTFGLSGEKSPQTVESVRPLGESELVLNGRKIPCQVRQAVLVEGTKKTTVKVHYSPDVKPHALRREWIAAAAPEGAATKTVEEVVSVGMPFLVAGEVKATAFIHTLQDDPKQTKESMEVTCDEVPGGIVSLSSKQLDLGGKLIERTTQELISYSVQQPRTPAPSRSRMIDRKRARRDDKMGRREP